MFTQYQECASNHGEYVELDRTLSFVDDLHDHMQPIPLRAGDIVSWDSRTTHANTENTSDLTRYVAYIAAGPARWDNPELVSARMDAFTSGIGSNVREALMHASKKSRYSDHEALAKVRQPERLTLLGELLYGKQRYEI